MVLSSQTAVFSAVSGLTGCGAVLSSGLVGSLQFHGLGGFYDGSRIQSG